MQLSDAAATGPLATPPPRPALACRRPIHALPEPAPAVQINYRIVEHDGGWAYQLGGTCPETFPDHDSARTAAIAASREQKVPDEDTLIEYADISGRWIIERVDGHDRPGVDVQA